jgi:hypothetical protein
MGGGNMSIEEGYRAVRDALAGSYGNYLPVGKCTKCGVDLRIDPVGGNCQPLHSFQFHMKGRQVGDQRQPGFGYLNGVCADFSWEADLCNQCLTDLTLWLKGKLNEIYPSQ